MTGFQIFNTLTWDQLNIEIIDLPGLGLVWGLSRLFLLSGRAALKIALALVGYFTLLLGEATELIDF